MRLQPLMELILPWIEPSQFPHIKQMLIKHGGNVTIHDKQYHLSFPAGTMIQEDNPHMAEVPRQKIIFPDGWWLLYEHARGSRLPLIVIDPPQGASPDA